MAKSTGLPPYHYKTENVTPVGTSGYVYARNLMATRLYRCPTIYLEPYVMNSRAGFRAGESGRLRRHAEGGGKRQPSIYREYVDGVVDGVLAYFKKARPLAEARRLTAIRYPARTAPLQLRTAACRSSIVTWSETLARPISCATTKRMRPFSNFLSRGERREDFFARKIRRQGDRQDDAPARRPESAPASPNDKPARRTETCGGRDQPRLIASPCSILPVAGGVFDGVPDSVAEIQERTDVVLLALVRRHDRGLEREIALDERGEIGRDRAARRARKARRRE